MQGPLRMGAGSVLWHALGPTTAFIVCPKIKLTAARVISRALVLVSPV